MSQTGTVCKGLILVLVFSAFICRNALGAGAINPLTACDAAASKAEHQWNLPHGLLAAIGAVESGRRFPGDGDTHPWPWSINADGQAFFASSRAMAIERVRDLQAHGARFIDIGCFQVDLAYHSTAFASLDDGFDPDLNATAAASILTEARMRTAAWSEAVALYHSASPARGGAYLRQVRNALPRAQYRLLSVFEDGSDTLPYAPLLSRMASLVRVVTVDTPAAAPHRDLPRVIDVSALHRPMPTNEAQIVWLYRPTALPRVQELEKKTDARERLPISKVSLNVPKRQPPRPQSPAR